MNDWIAHLVRIAPYRDVIEIIFFSTICYYIQLWLKKDTERNLLFAFYLYCASFFVAHYAHLPVIRHILFLASPVIAILFIILHQETLQKNFVKLAKGKLPLNETSHWIDELIKCCLTALNRHKEIILIIERNDPLKSIIHAPYFIYAELKKDVFDILLEKHIAHNDYMIWINQQGKLVAISATWRTQLDEAWMSNETKIMNTWKQQALFITAKTDTLLFKVNPLTRSFDLIMQGKITEGVRAEQLSAFMKKNLLSPKNLIQPVKTVKRPTTLKKEPSASESNPHN